MLIDWFTVVAQALNFLVLVWLMKRFLYRPILDAIDAREARIAGELADADAKKAEAQAKRDAFEHKNEVFDQQCAALFNQAAEKARVERRRLMDEARAEAAELNARRREALRREADNLNETLRRRTGHEVFAIARKVLSDLAATSLEERIVEVFIRRVRAMDGNAKSTLAAALAAASEPAVVRSAFELPDPQRAAVEHALRETSSADVPIRFETEPDLVSGIELRANGQGVDWSIAGYLASLEREMSELLDRNDADHTAHAAGPPIAVATGT